MRSCTVTKANDGRLQVSSADCDTALIDSGDSARLALEIKSRLDGEPEVNENINAESLKKANEEIEKAGQ